MAEQLGFEQCFRQAEQLTATKGPPERLLRLWMARATSSLPVPDSPSSTTEASQAAISDSMPVRRMMAGLTPIISSAPPFGYSVAATASRGRSGRMVSTAPMTRSFRSLMTRC